MKKFNQVLSVAISAALTVTSAPWHVYAAEVGAMPEFVKTFTPPTRLGYVTESYKGKTLQPIILIQDLHANYGVQKKVNELLKFIQPNATPNGAAMVLGREAAWEQVDVSYFKSLPIKQRKEVLDILMKNAEITAKEYFAAMSDTPVNEMGIDNKADYLLVLGLVRRSAAARLRLASKVNALDDSLQKEKAKAPADLRRLLKAEEDYRAGNLSMEDMARKLHVASIPDYNFLENRLLERKIELAGKAGKDAGRMQNVIVADHFLSLLSRLLRQQMTLEEVKMVARESYRLEGIVKTFLPNEDINEWKEIVNAAVDYYAIAMVRDRPLSDNSIALAANHPDQPVVVVVGGFHAAGMEQNFRNQGVSFLSIAPVVESHTISDEMLYLQRILGNHMDSTAINTAVSQYSSHSAQLTDLMAPNAGHTIDPTIASVTEAVTGQAPNVPTVAPADAKDIDPTGTPKKSGDKELNPVYIPGKVAYIPTAKDLEKNPDAVEQAKIDGVVNDALGFFDQKEADKLRADIASGKVTVVVRDHNAAAQTFRNVDGTGKIVIVLDKGQFQKGGNVALVNVAKELVNVTSETATSEIDTLPKLFSILGKGIGLEAVKQAYADMGADAMPIVEAIQELISNGLGDPAQWKASDMLKINAIVQMALNKIDEAHPGFLREANGTEKELNPVLIPGEAQPWVSPLTGADKEKHEGLVQTLVSKFTMGGRDMTAAERAQIEAAKESIEAAA